MGSVSARNTVLLLWLWSCPVACGGVAVQHGATDGGTGGNAGSTGGTSNSGGASNSGGKSGSGGSTSTPLPDCTNPVPAGSACSTPSAHCGGPCVNSWQADNVCMGGTWMLSRTVACGPNASHAPQCHNSFGGGELTPCCPTGQLECAGKPDRYPGFGCTPGDNSFCSCNCYSGMSQCGC